MTDIINEAATGEGEEDTAMGNSVENIGVQEKTTASNYQTLEYLFYFFFGVLEVLLVFRLLFKLSGANSTNAFIGFIYGTTGLFIVPFEGIFNRTFSQGSTTSSILEPATLVALFVYAFLSWGIVKLISIFSGEQQ